MKKGVKKGLIIAGISVGGIIALLLLTVIVIIAFEPYFYGDFFGNARQEFMLPGISDDFVQQGITYSDGEFLSCGYMSGEKRPSRVYITDHESGASRYVGLKDENGAEYYGHAGGLAAYGDKLLVCDSEGGSGILVFDIAEVKNADGGFVTAKGAFPVDCNASFCYVEGDILYVGEFYREQNYKTNASHHLTTPAGGKHHALIFGYPLSPSEPLALASAVPVLAYSVTDLAQGMCITPGGRIVISTSYALANSHNYIYKKPAEEPGGDFDLNGAKIPLWYLDSAALDDDIVLPPMSEELVCVDGRVYVIGEAASNKYFFGKLLRAKYVWSYPAT